jgi:hypothetical protein
MLLISGVDELYMGGNRYEFWIRMFSLRYLFIKALFMGIK